MKGAMKGHIDYNGQTYNVVNLQDWLNQQQLSSNSIIELQSGLKSNHTDYSYIVLLPRLWAIMISCLNGSHTYDDSGIRWRSCNKGTTELSQKTWLTGVVKDSLTPIFDANELSILFDETLKKPNLKGGDN
jgi:chemotaxis signal transduction protein